MSAITLREVKGSKLTHNEMDDNFNNLNEDKLEKSLYATNNPILIRNNSGDIVEVEVDPSTIVGRKATGEIVALTVAELRTMLAVTSTGWADPTGTTDKTTFATSTVTTEELAKRVKGIYEALKAAGILSA